MRRQFYPVFIIGLILLTGLYFSTSAWAAEPAAKPAASAADPAAKPAEAVKAPAAQPADPAKAPAKPAEAAKPPAKPSEAGKPAKEPSLKVTSRGKNAVTLELQNEVPVRALQFTVTEAKITEVRTTGRTKGFLAKFNEQNGKVIILSTAGEEIASGKGAITEIVCDKPASAKLVDVTIVWNR
jgi:hypothetical protein